MAIIWPAKSPNEFKDYQLNWSPQVSDDPIDTSEWLPVSDITVSMSSKTDTTTSVWLSGGVLGKTYELTNRVVTAGGRILEQSVEITIQHK